MSSSTSSNTPLTTDDVLDEIERLDQNITRTMQEIDQSFSDCQIIVSTKILPQIDRFAESSREVWEHARLWTSFFEAAMTPATPAVGRRAQAIRNARNRQQAALAAATSTSSPTTAQSESVTPEHNSHHHQRATDNDLNNSTNRRRISSINLVSSRLSPDFLDSSPIGSMPPTPTPLSSSRKHSQHQGTHIVPPAKIQWPQDAHGNGTPIRRPYGYNAAGPDRGSTTPTVTLRDRPMPLSSYTQTKTTTPTRGNVSGGFLELDVEEDHQDVVTPPSTLQFSIPESKVATTPRSVLAKSRVNKIQMKDGLVIPQPIFVNDDDDVEDAAFVERYTGQGSDEFDIGGSKKRGREDEHAGEGQSWISLTEQQRNKERLLKSPRKMASVQDFFAVPSSTARTGNRESDTADEDGRQQNQDEENGDEIDPLLAALATPPEIRRGIMEYKARASLLPQRPAPPAWSVPVTTTTTNAAVATAAATITSSSVPPSSASSVEASSSATVITPTPIGSTISSTMPAVKATSNNSIDSLFKESFSTGFEATSTRRQTMATPTEMSQGAFGQAGASTSRGPNARNSIGSAFRTALTSAPFSTPIATGSGNSRLSMLGSALRKPLYPTSPSPASRAAASAIVNAAAAGNVPSQQRRTPPPPSPRRTAGLARPSIPAGMMAFSAGRTTRPTSTPAASASRPSQVAGATPSGTPGQGNTQQSQTGEYSATFSTPFSRNPPPAPRLGYHSDTLMTQSSLGLNHDGFGGYESEERTRMTMPSTSSSGMGGRGLLSSGGERLSSGISESAEYTEGTEDETEGDGDDEDATGNIMRSPCPPGRTFYGSTTDLKSVAKATASNPTLASKSSAASQPQRRF
ncbi:DASH complex subunit ask1 [Mortierella sp. GBA35]|nr:DASH complex subunit ask1 [Mortierella sp. GBA35]